MILREVFEEDLQELLAVYCFLHEDSIPQTTDHLKNVWKQILKDPHHHIIVAIEDKHIVSSCVCVIIQNLTRNARPYALIENVVTDVTYRKNGIASQCLRYAISLARTNHCYKIMLLSSSKEEDVLHFYRQAGFNSKDKTAFIQWL